MPVKHSELKIYKEASKERAAWLELSSPLCRVQERNDDYGDGRQTDGRTGGGGADVVLSGIQSQVVLNALRPLYGTIWSMRGMFRSRRTPIPCRDVYMLSLRKGTPGLPAATASRGL